MKFTRGNPRQTLGIGKKKLYPIYKERPSGRWDLAVSYRETPLKITILQSFSSKEDAEKAYERFIESGYTFNFYGKYFQKGVEI